jgi:hypothetical protein
MLQRRAPYQGTDWPPDCEQALCCVPSMYLARRFVDIGDDVGDKGAQELLAGAHAHAGCVPCGFEIVGQPGEIRRGGEGVRANREINREFRGNRPSAGILTPNRRANSMVCNQIPYAMEQGIFKRVSGKIFQGTGNFHARCFDFEF